MCVGIQNLNRIFKSLQNYIAFIQPAYFSSLQPLKIHTINDTKKWKINYYVFKHFEKCKLTSLLGKFTSVRIFIFQNCHFILQILRICFMGIKKLNKHQCYCQNVGKQTDQVNIIMFCAVFPGNTNLSRDPSTYKMQ